MAGVSVKEHGAHVDFASSPKDAYVSLTFGMGTDFADVVTVRRTLARSTLPTIAPDTESTRAVLAHLLQHPETTLSRREIVRFIIGEASNRSEQVELLLQLDGIRETRAILQRIANSDSRDQKSADAASKTSLDALGRAVIREGAPKAELLEEINRLRVVIGLPGLDDLTLSTNVLADAPEAGVVSAGSTHRDEWLRQIVDAIEGIAGTRNDLDRAFVHASDLAKVEPADSSSAVQHSSFLDRAIHLFDGHECPACGTDWDSDNFLRTVSMRQEQHAARAKSVLDLDQAMSRYADLFRNIVGRLRPVLGISEALAPSEDASAFKRNYESLVRLAGSLNEGQREARVANFAAADSLDLAPHIANLEQLREDVLQLPQVSEQIAARSKLETIAARISDGRAMALNAKKALAKASRSAAAIAVFEAARSEVLEDAYASVQTRFAELYAICNSDDESDFSAEFAQRGPSLDLVVDFYGRGSFPPNAYHSEGHQDAMGLCLYLALMETTHGKNFSFALLDDVVMSIDAGHRKAVASMLATQFADTQFILTTHDEIWLQQMRTQGFVGRKQIVHFRDWSLEDGPTDWSSYDSISAAREFAEDGHIEAAASTLRRYLEHTFRELCDAVGGKVRYRLDGKNDLGDLIPAAQTGLRSAIAKARTAEASWGHDAKVADLGQRDVALKNAGEVTQHEQWAINAAVHYNEWANFTKQDLLPVIDSFANLVDQYLCNDCGSHLRLNGPENAPDGLRCTCGATNFNLLKKT